MIVMNIFSIVAVFLPYLTLFQCLEAKLTNITIDEKYNCLSRNNQSTSSIKTMTRSVQYETNTTCTETSHFKSSPKYNITFENRQVMSVTFKSLDTISSRVNGNELFAQHGFIKDGFCAGGYIYIIDLGYDPKNNSCSTNEGLVQPESIESSVIIVGGACDSKCTGIIKEKFIPGIN